MQKWLNSEVRVGPSSVLLALLIVASAGVFVWQLARSGDPSAAGAMTSAIFTALFSTVLSVTRGYQAARAKG